MFDGLKRRFIFGKIAGAIEDYISGKPSDGKVLGWDMGNWKAWLEGAAYAVGAAIAGAAAQAFQSGQPFDKHAFGSTAVLAGGAALAAYLRKSPTDPRRDDPSIPPATGTK